MGCSGANARAAGIEPHTRPGWYVGLENYCYHRTRSKSINPKSQARLVTERDQLEAEVGRPLYLPFELGAMRPLRQCKTTYSSFLSFSYRCIRRALETQNLQREIRERPQHIGNEYRFAKRRNLTVNGSIFS